MTIHLIYIYAIINSFVLGSYLLDGFNDDSLWFKLKFSVFIFFFGGILVLYEFTIAKKVDKWIDSSDFGFWWRMNIQKKFDNLPEESLKYIIGQIRYEHLEKKPDNKLIKHLNKILKSNGR